MSTLTWAQGVYSGPISAPAISLVVILVYISGICTHFLSYDIKVSSSNT